MKSCSKFLGTVALKVNFFETEDFFLLILNVIFRDELIAYRILYAMAFVLKIVT